MFKINFCGKTVARVESEVVALAVAEQLKGVAETIAQAQPRGIYSVLVMEQGEGESRQVLRWLKRG